MSKSSEPIAVSSVTKEFSTTSGRVPACVNLSFQVQEGDILAVVGQTGCGKSTLLALILGLIEPSRGSVRVLGLDPFRQFYALRGKIGIVFQTDRLLPWRTALENVAYGLEILRVPRRERIRRSGEWLERVGLKTFASCYPHEMSGGMRQRLSIARTFAIAPPVLLADEAFSALDEITAAALRHDLVSLIQDTKTTTVFVTHSVAEAADIATRVLVLAQPAHVVHDVNVADLRKRGWKSSSIEDEVRRGLQAARPTDGQPNSTSANVADTGKLGIA